MLPQTFHLYQQIIQMPDAVLLVNSVMDNMREEARKRQAFLDIVHENCSAEFINGNIIMHSPVKGIHWRICTNLVTYLNYYVRENNLGLVGNEKVMIQLTRNNYEPDIVFFSKEKAADFTDEQMLFPAPDFVVEILSKSTWENDYGIKFNDYAAHGVSEYWIINPEKHIVEQYILENGEFQIYQKLVEKGTLKAFAIAGFEINIETIFQ